MTEDEKNRMTASIMMELEGKKDNAVRMGVPPYFLSNFFLRVYDNPHRQALEKGNPEIAKMNNRIDAIILEMNLRQKLDQLLLISGRAHKDPAKDYEYTSQERLNADLEIDKLLIPVYIRLRLEGYDPEKFNITT